VATKISPSPPLGSRLQNLRLHPHFGSPLQNLAIEENDLILTETYLDRSKNELAETHSIGLKNDPERFLSR